MPNRLQLITTRQIRWFQRFIFLERWRTYPENICTFLHSNTSLAYIKVNHYITKRMRGTTKQTRKENNAATFSVLVQNVTKTIYKYKYVHDTTRAPRYFDFTQIWHEM